MRHHLALKSLDNSALAQETAEGTHAPQVDDVGAVLLPNLLSEFDFSAVLSSFWNELLVPLLSLS